MARFIWPTVLVVAAIWLPSRPLHAQDDWAQKAAYYGESDWSAYDASLSARDGEAGVENVSLNGLKSLGRKAWPLVRRYVWLSTYAGDDLFAGYSQPLVDADGERIEFQLLIDRGTWEACEPAMRQKKLYDAQAHFDNRMSELNLKGSLKIVLTNR